MAEQDEVVAMAAYLYYILNQSQGQIAERLEVSASKVSRMIKEAHERGLVEINIRMPIPRDFELEQTLMTLFGLKEAQILKTTPDSSAEQLLSTIGRLAATYLQRIIETFPADALVGVAWGSGVHAAVSALPNNTSRQTDVVQLLGGVGAVTIDSPDLARMVAAKLGGRHYDLHAPVLVAKAAARETFLAEPVVREGIRRAKAVDLAIIGVGSVQDEDSSFLKAGLLTRTDLAQLRRQGAVGEVCGQFFDIHGRHDMFDINQRAIAIDLDDVRRLPRVVAIARGISKASSILGALRGRYLNALATDDVTARAILALANESEPDG